MVAAEQQIDVIKRNLLFCCSLGLKGPEDLN